MQDVTPGTVADAGIGAQPSVLVDACLEPGIGLMTLNRPQARNSLSLAMLQTLHAAILQLGQDVTVQAIVLTAAGSVFSAGHDLKEIMAHRADPDGGRAFYELAMTACAQAMQAIMACPKPVIAAVDGTATAAGCQLVATCDLAVAAEHAKFCTPGVNIGLFCSTPMVALSRNVSRKAAMEMLLTGDLIGAEEAQRIGLVARVFDDDDFAGGTSALVGRLAAASPPALRTMKQNFLEAEHLGLAEFAELEAQRHLQLFTLADTREAFAAKVEKRASRFTGN